ncbi:transposase [uncultured Tateyamaria sp.]|uniref:transposase n=1 Tax=uncultured Tateyamaria sp. TaxID=455651 RepID=UPI002620147B|nr:transposase [uncultured Tateyamaria sp.]
MRPSRGWTKKCGFSGEQIIGMIKEYEAGVKAKELCQKYVISDATLHKYKAKFGGMNVSDAKKLTATKSTERSTNGFYT